MYHGTYPTLPWGWNTHTHTNTLQTFDIYSKTFADFVICLYVTLMIWRTVTTGECDISVSRLLPIFWGSQFQKNLVSQKKTRGILILNTNGTPKDFCFFPYCLLFFIVVNVSSISLQLLGELFSVHPIPTHFAVHTWELPITEHFIDLTKKSLLLFTDKFHRFSRFHGYIPLWLYEGAKLSFLGFKHSLVWGEAFMLDEEVRAGGNSFCSGSPKAWIRHHEWNLHGSNVARSELSVTHPFSKFSWPFII